MTWKMATAPAVAVEVYVGGNAWTLDDPVLGRLDAGNVLGPTADGWLSVTCSTIRSSWRIGATAADGPMSRMDSGYCRVELWDPARTFDPANQSGPWWPRFNAGAPFRLRAEMPGVDPAADAFSTAFEPGSFGPLGAVPPPELRYLFSGRLWALGWSDGIATLESSDPLADLAAWTGPTSAAEGAGDTAGERIARILDFMGYAGPVDLEATGVEVIETTHGVAATVEIEKVRATDLGLFYADPAGQLIYRAGPVWNAERKPVVNVGEADCSAVRAVTKSGATISTVRNVIYGNVPSGVELQETDADSVARFGPRRWGRTDLLHADDGDRAVWCSTLLDWYRAPMPGAVQVLEVEPDPTAPWLWDGLTGLRATDPVALQLPGMDATLLVVGWAHEVTAERWRARLIVAQHPVDYGDLTWWTLDDPGLADQLDAGNVLTP